MRLGIDLSASLTDALTSVCQHANRSLVVVQNGRRGAGAGVIWRPGGILVTNHHVIQRGKPRISLMDGREFSARVLAKAKHIDLAVLKIEIPNGESHDLSAAPVADSQNLRIGQIALALGHPWGQIGSASMGIITSLGSVRLRWRRDTVDVIRTDAGLAPGNSGGPLINASGAVIGINTMIVGGDLGVAIPSHVVSEFVDRALGQNKLPVAG